MEKVDFCFFLRSFKLKLITIEDKRFLVYQCDSLLLHSHIIQISLKFLEISEEVCCSVFLLVGSHREGKGQKPPKHLTPKKGGGDVIFSCMGIIKISFSVIFNKEIHAVRGYLS